jgi:hypothetical protein|tara:strand:- start:1216 stop:1494 length:279 start_codon:yes stop_codon:yes gene_type:complete
MSEEETETQEQEAPQPSEINLNDLAVVLQIIDVCSKRGAFEGNELKDVGTLRERIATFVNARMPKKEDVEDNGEGDSDDAPTEPVAAAESDS